MTSNKKCVYKGVNIMSWLFKPYDLMDGHWSMSINKVRSIIVFGIPLLLSLSVNDHGPYIIFLWGQKQSFTLRCWCMEQIYGPTNVCFWFSCWREKLFHLWNYLKTDVRSRIRSKITAILVVSFGIFFWSHV